MLRKVLCIDDDVITLTLNKILLSRTGFASEVLTARNGREALDCIASEEEGSIDLVLLDLNMPVMDGWEFLAEYELLNGPDYPANVVILSSSVNQADVDRARDCSLVLDFVTKPLMPENLGPLKQIEGLKARFATA